MGISAQAVAWGLIAPTAVFVGWLAYKVWKGERIEFAPPRHAEVREPERLP